MLLAPYLRKFGQYTIPDFLAARYGGRLPRLVGLLAAILCSFVYVVAQIYGVGLITTQLTGVDFVLGIFLGLGGVLVCSFLGGMRAVTWTQVAQYIVLVIAYMVPVVWLSIKQTGVPVPQFVIGQQLAKVSEREQQLLNDPKEIEVRALFQARADAYAGKLKDVPAALVADRTEAQRRSRELKAGDAPLREIQAADKALATQPATAGDAREAWTRAQAADAARALPLAGMPPHGPAVRRRPGRRRRPAQGLHESRRNFLALVLLPDGGHGRAAAHPDALATPRLRCGAGARVGGLVAVLHPAAVPDGAGARGAGQVRGVQRARRPAVRPAAGLDRGAGRVSIRRWCR